MSNSTNPSTKNTFRAVKGVTLTPPIASRNAASRVRHGMCALRPKVLAVAARFSRRSIRMEFDQAVIEQDGTR